MPIFILHLSLPIGKAAPLSFLSQGHAGPLLVKNLGLFVGGKSPESDVSRLSECSYSRCLMYLSPAKTQILLVVF